MKKMLKVKYICFIFVCSVLLIGFVVTIFKYSYSVYTDNKSWTYNYDSGAMYISSDFLTYDDNGFIVFKNYDTNSLHFKVFNYESDSQISAFDIVYDISCSVGNGYTCKIDGNNVGIENVSLNKSFTCSSPGLTEEQCKNDSNATLTYNKVFNDHTVSVSGSAPPSTGNTNVLITLTTKKPYKTVLTGSFQVYFTDQQGFKYSVVESSSSRCKYIVTNFGDSYEQVTVTTASNVKFKDGTTQYSTYLNKYQRVILEVIKKSASLSCDNAISIS